MEIPQCRIAGQIDGKEKPAGFFKRLKAKFSKKKKDTGTASEPASVERDLQDPDEIKRIVQEATKAEEQEVDMMDDDFDEDFND